ncbi:MAG TPA: enoyl-CoA hydratase-related protein [Anaeromyxobacteraceae bacterium]|nr:enoyl-CoA hydratase-related protein [Anaeromyxobacteraceae bacterium]
MQLENILFRVEEGVGVATFHRPKALNALDRRSVAEFAHLLDAVAADRALRALVLTGSGERAFVAGADISEMSRLTAAEARQFAEEGQRVLARLEALSVPTIAAVNGFALGGGCEITLACDLVYANEKAFFGQPEVNLGIIPGFGGTQRLPRRVGPMRAKELILGGDMIDAKRAKDIGLCLEVLSQSELMPYVMGQAKKIATRGPLAVASAKRAMDLASTASLAAFYPFEAAAFALLCASEDAREGMGAFLEKRTAAFKGG